METKRKTIEGNGSQMGTPCPPTEKRRSGCGGVAREGCNPSEVRGDAFPVNPGVWNVLEQGKKRSDQVPSTSEDGNTTCR